MERLFVRLMADSYKAAITASDRFPNDYGAAVRYFRELMSDDVEEFEGEPIDDVEEVA